MVSAQNEGGSIGARERGTFPESVPQGVGPTTVGATPWRLQAIVDWDASNHKPIEGLCFFETALLKEPTISSLSGAEERSSLIQAFSVRVGGGLPPHFVGSGALDGSQHLRGAPTGARGETGREIAFGGKPPIGKVGTNPA